MAYRDGFVIVDHQDRRRFHPRQSIKDELLRFSLLDGRYHPPRFKLIAQAKSAPRSAARIRAGRCPASATHRPLPMGDVCSRNGRGFTTFDRGGVSDVETWTGMVFHAVEDGASGRKHVASFFPVSRMGERWSCPGAGHAGCGENEPGRALDGDPAHPPACPPSVTPRGSTD